MFVNDKIIYLQLQKTGCTHIAGLLNEYLGGTSYHKHGRIDRPSEGRLVIGSVRNPWDWYVSLWAYGCMGRGAINARLTQSRWNLALTTVRGTLRRSEMWKRLPELLVRQSRGHELGFWRRVYADATDHGAFREWLHAIHDPEVQNLVFEDSRTMPSLHQAVGLYTARLVYLYSDPSVWDDRSEGFQSFEDIVSFFDTHSVLDRTIRTERIEADLAEVMTLVGVEDISVAQLAKHDKTNTSKRDQFETYYDKSTATLIAKRDCLIANRYGYDAPQI